MDKPTHHIPVLTQAISDLFVDAQLTCFVDATLGAAGHAYRLLDSHPELTQFIGIDQDADALEIAGEQLFRYGERARLLRGNFRDVGHLLDKQGIGQIDGAMIDLGVSSMQLDRPEKGFSFRNEGPLDMRMDRSGPVTAADLLNKSSEEEIGRILRDYGEIPHWRSLARQIIHERPFVTTLDLRRLRMGPRRRKIDPMTLLFQALRIAVNDELGALEAVLPQLIERLRPGARLAVISFHSLEDGIVKRFFRDAAASRLPDPTHPMGYREQEPTLRILTKKPIQPSDEEARHNPRSRSARLRGAEKL